MSGIAVSDQDVFVAFGSGWSTGSKSKLYRFDTQLQNPVLLAEGLRGCCQRCDIIARDGVLYLAENSAHRVVSYNRDGEVLDKWGERSRTDLEGFGACCNPMNVCFDAEGVLYTSGSGLGRIKLLRSRLRRAARGPRHPQLGHAQRKGRLGYTDGVDRGSHNCSGPER